MVGGGKSLRGKAESRSFSPGLFCKMNMDSVIRRGISWRTLATIWKPLRFMPELHIKAWSRKEECGGWTRGRPVRGLIPLCSAVRVCNVRMDDPYYPDAHLAQLCTGVYSRSQHYFLGQLVKLSAHKNLSKHQLYQTILSCFWLPDPSHDFILNKKNVFELFL